MKVYLTGVHAIKSSKKNSKDSSSLNKYKNHEVKFDNENIKEESLLLESERKQNPSNNNNNYTNGKIIFTKSNITQNNIKTNDSKNNNINIIKNKNNNFITRDDQETEGDKKRKKNFKCQKDFNKIRNQYLENKKINEEISNQLKEEYLEYIMLKEPKYADFNKISEDYRHKIYHNYKKYNDNLIKISQKEKEHKKLLFEMEKSLINNYYVKDSSMLPIYEKLIQKLKIEVLTKQQEHDGYKKQYEELYNQNYTIKRKVLDEIDIDRVNEDFYDQYKLLKIHAIVQVSKKQDTLNQIEEYHQKVLEEHEKEIKQKNKILKELKLEIEVFKEDEKDLVHKLRKLKAKREQVKKIIKERENKIKIYEFNYLRYAKRYQKSFIGMNKIFKSVNAKNLDDVLLDVNSINARFNNLKNKIIKLNQDISNLNSEYSNLNRKLNEINQEIISVKNKKNTFFNQQDQKRIIEIKNELKKINENENRIKEITQNNIGIFQKGISFIFSKIKLLVTNVGCLKKSISPKLVDLINNYKHTPFSVDYEKIDKTFLTNYSFLFFQFSNIIFYLSLRSMSSGVNVNNLEQKEVIMPIYSKVSLHIYKDGVKKALKEYGRRTLLKNEKQKEINIKTKKKEIEEKIDSKLMKENKAVTQHQMFNRFVDYLHNKDSNSFREKTNRNENGNLNFNTNKTSIFFTGIDSVKSKNLDNSSVNSKYSKYTDSFNRFGKDKNPNSKEFAISLKQKEEFLKKNKNKVMNIFSKYQNTLVKEIDKNLYFQKKYMKLVPRTRSQEQIKRKTNYIRNQFINKRKINKEDNFDQKKSMPNLLDENYEYDEDDYEEDYKRKLSFKKNKTFSNFSFFRLNKDRANIYKKMNDLRKLQMAYFGGRFLNTKITSGMNTTYGGNVFDEFVNNYYKRQNEHNNINSKSSKRKLNFGKKLVDQITANQKLRSKSTAIRCPPKNKNNNNLINTKERNRFRKINDNMKTSFSINNKKTTVMSRSINKYRKIDNSRTNNRGNSRSSNSNYKTISIKSINKNLSKSKDRSEIYNYKSKNL